jgi:myb proto-oncogene protein
MGSRDKTRVPKITGPSSSPSSTSQALVVSVANKVAEAPPDAEKKPQDVKTQPKLVSHHFHTEV